MSNTAAQPHSIAISVIVPVYNVETWVGDCLQSLLDQAFDQPFEVILIDDASSDHSAAICRQFQHDYPGQVHLLENPENAGVSVARNRGLEAMQGRYFMFVDPDDLLPQNALADLYRAAEQSGATIVKGNNSIFSAASEKPAPYDVDRNSLLEGDEALVTLFRHDRLRGHTWGKLFRAENLADCRFVAGLRMTEDLLYCCETFSRAQSLLLINRSIYRYRSHAGGAKGKKYANGSYLEWLDTVETSGHFARSPKQVRAHKQLQLRTMAQMARECRELEPALARELLPVIREKCAAWHLRLVPLILRYRQGPRSLGRYIKIQRAIGDIERRIRDLTD